MSMNLYVEATVTVTLPNGKSKEIQEPFNLIQTRTNDSYQILNSPDKYQEYKKLYGDTGGKLSSWLKKMAKEGYTIHWYVM